MSGAERVRRLATADHRDFRVDQPAINLPDLTLDPVESDRVIDQQLCAVLSIATAGLNSELLVHPTVRRRLRASLLGRATLTWFEPWGVEISFSVSAEEFAGANNPTITAFGQEVARMLGLGPETLTVEYLHETAIGGPHAPHLLHR